MLEVLEPFFITYLAKYRHQTGNLQDFWMKAATAIDSHFPIDVPNISKYYLKVSNDYPKSLVTDEELSAIQDPTERDDKRSERDMANELRNEKLMEKLCKVNQTLAVLNNEFTDPCSANR